MSSKKRIKSYKRRKRQKMQRKGILQKRTSVDIEEFITDFEIASNRTVDNKWLIYKIIIMVVLMVFFIYWFFRRVQTLMVLLIDCFVWLVQTLMVPFIDWFVRLVQTRTGLDLLAVANKLFTKLHQIIHFMDKCFGAVLNTVYRLCDPCIAGFSPLQFDITSR